MTLKINWAIEPVHLMPYTGISLLGIKKNFLQTLEWDKCTAIGKDRTQI